MASNRASVIVPSRVYSGLELSRLEELASDEAKLLEYFLTLELEEVEQARKDCERVTQANKELASTTYGKKTEFEEKKARFVDISIRATELKEVYNEMYGKLKSYSNNTDQKKVLKRLRDMSREIENESEDLASAFLAGGSELRPEEFIDQFRSKRTMYWLRKIKSEKMDKLIKERPVQPPPSASFMPYPVAGMSGPGMPQPFRSSSSPQSARPPLPKPAPYAGTQSVSVPRASQTSSAHPSQSFPPSYVHSGNPNPSPTQSVPPPSYAQASQMPMPQLPPSHSVTSTSRYPQPTTSLYGRSPQQYSMPPPAIGRPAYPVQPYPYGPRPPYPPRT